MSGFIAPVRRAAGGINTGVALSNAESQAVSLDLTLRNQQGQEVPGGRRTIENFPARGHLARFIDELLPEAEISGFEGTLVVNATGGQIAATALELGPAPGQFTTLPVTPLTGGGTATEFFFAQFGSGGGFTSDTVLVNPRAVGSVSGTLVLLDEQGQPMPVGLGGSGLREQPDVFDTRSGRRDDFDRRHRVPECRFRPGERETVRWEEWCGFRFPESGSPVSAKAVP